MALVTTATVVPVSSAVKNKQREKKRVSIFKIKEGRPKLVGMGLIGALFTYVIGFVNVILSIFGLLISLSPYMAIAMCISFCIYVISRMTFATHFELYVSSVTFALVCMAHITSYYAPMVLNYIDKDTALYTGRFLVGWQLAIAVLTIMYPVSSEELDRNLSACVTGIMVGTMLIILSTSKR